MVEKKLIDIIIPLYNTEKYIGECIDSCLEQTYEDYTITIVNDGSKDRSLEIVTEYAKKHPDKISIISKKNGGIATALNEGMKNMNGDWFKWLSSDDKFNDRHALKDMMRLISTIPQHKAYLFYTNYNIIDENGDVVKPFDEPNRSHLTREYRNAQLMNNFYGNGSSTLIHKSLIKEVGMFREGMPFAEDLEYWLRICIKFGFTMYHLPLRTIQYRVHSQQTTQTMDVAMNLKLKNEIIDEYLPYLNPNQLKYLKELDSQRPLRRRILYKMPSGMRNTAIKLYRRVK